MFAGYLQIIKIMSFCNIKHYLSQENYLFRGYFMSNLFKEAIVDANALREAALKSAESTIIDKYSDEVRAALDGLLEQDELGGFDLGADPAADLAADPAADLGVEVEGEGEADGIEEDVEDVPYAATDGANKMDGKNLKNIPGDGEDVEVTLDLGALRESVATLQAEIDEELEFNEEELAEMLSDGEEEELGEDREKRWRPGDPVVHKDPESDVYAGATGGQEKGREDKGKDPTRKKKEETTKEEIEISDELIDTIAEKLTVDMGADLAGWAGRSSEDMKFQIEKELAHRRSTDVEEDLETLKKAQEELVFENKQLKKRLTQYKQATKELKETLQNVNLSNARLLYTNRVLRNTSLNERQKKRIVEAISKADSVAEAKTIHNTLESAVEAKPRRSPQSLSEAISRPSSVIRATRHESVQQADPFLDRMQKLAGIK